MGGPRSDTRRIFDLHRMYHYEIYCPKAGASASFGCPGCQRASGVHQCPHEMMQCLSFVYDKSEYLLIASILVFLNYYYSVPLFLLYTYMLMRAANKIFLARLDICIYIIIKNYVIFAAVVNT